VLFRGETLAGIAAGEIDLAFRRWPRARVKAGTKLRTAIGVLEVVAVDKVDPKRLDVRDALHVGSGVAEIYSVRRGMRRFHESRIVLQLSRKKARGVILMAHPAFRGVGVTSSSISAPSNALPRFRTL
jgi:hypothetical protein